MWSASLLLWENRNRVMCVDREIRVADGIFPVLLFPCRSCSKTYLPLLHASEAVACLLLEAKVKVRDL